MVPKYMTTLALNASAVTCDVALQLAIDAKQSPNYYCTTELAGVCCNACRSNLSKTYWAENILFGKWRKNVFLISMFLEYNALALKDNYWGCPGVSTTQCAKGTMGGQLVSSLCPRLCGGAKCLFFLQSTFQFKFAHSTYISLIILKSHSTEMHWCQLVPEWCYLRNNRPQPEKPLHCISMHLSTRLLRKLLWKQCVLF